MERYLTENAKRRRVRDLPLALLSIGLGGLTLQVGTEDLRVGAVPRGDIVYHVLATALLLWLVLLPLISVARRRWRQRLARRISAALARREEDAISLADLDSLTGVRNAGRKVKKLIARDFLQKLAVDEDEMALRLDSPRAEAPEPPRAVPDGTDAVLARIRALNDDIEDAQVSAHIDRIESLTASIFNTVRQRPECADAARKFVNYYLPTTLKLLQSYSLMEEQSYQGENITASRRQIERVLDKLVYAVERQQDKLFQAEALDVESDIRVLETMMAADGLSGRE